MRYEQQPAWLLLKKPDTLVIRQEQPTRLELSEAVRWVESQKPILWIGSVFSTPEPSGFPSGYAISRSIFDLIFPVESCSLSTGPRNDIDSLIRKWPLESLFDEFEALKFDLPNSLLRFFSRHDKQAMPNRLHGAVTEYYRQGKSRAPFCITTNWDSLLEKSFLSAGYEVQVGGPEKRPENTFWQHGEASRCISVFHPHGSFATGDVVCSFVREQQQLPLPVQLFSEPTLFLGYSGYEPSLYRNLEHNAGQLWCIRDESDLEIPAKRRLLSRPDTFAFVGDLRELLNALGLLEGHIDLESRELTQQVPLPRKVAELMQLAVAAKSDLGMCLGPLPEVLYGFFEEPEASLRYSTLIRGIRSHVRDRAAHPGIPLALMAAVGFRDDEELWVDCLAYLLRNAETVTLGVTERLISQAENSRLRQAEALQKELEEEAWQQVLAFRRSRARCYKAFLGRPEAEDDDVTEFMLNSYSPIALGDLGLAGELAELAGFASHRKGELERAAGFFDSAATFYYLDGLWRAGEFCESMSRRTHTIEPEAMMNTLFISDDRREA